MHLHANNVVHRDLKLDNIMLKKISKRKWCAKLGDFGQARQLRYKEEKMKGFYGNQGTVTPEMLQLRKVRKQGESKAPGYNYKVDVWAFGSIFYSLFTTKPPFDKYDTERKSKFDLARAVMRGTWSLPERYRDAMSNEAL